jgi:hypothetical protein
MCIKKGVEVKKLEQHYLSHIYILNMVVGDIFVLFMNITNGCTEYHIPLIHHLKTDGWLVIVNKPKRVLFWCFLEN